MNGTVYIIITVAIYLLGMLAVGVYYAKKNKTTDDFYLGGRKLGPLVTAMSAEASDMSSYLLMGLPGLAFASGIADVGWTIVGLGLGTYAAWLFIAKRLRRYSHVVNAITIPEFFSKRFHDKSGILTAIAALVIIVFFIPYTGSGFAACGKLFSTLFGTQYMVAMVISALVIVGYTMSGGFLAASMTDFIQSILMTFALVFVLFFSVIKAGGVNAVIANAKELPGFLSFFNTYSDSTGTSSPYGWLTIIATLSWGLGYMGMPHFLIRFMAIKDENKLKISRRVASIWVVLSMIIVVIIGIAGRTLVNSGLIPAMEDSETLLVEIASYLGNSGVFFAFVAGLIISGMLASTMSTADSQMIQASSSISQDLLQGTFKMKISSQASMIIARLTIFAIAVVGIIIARKPDSNVFNIVSFAWAGFGAAFGPLMLCSLFWKRTTKYGALAGMISGGAMVFIWKYLIKPMGGVFGIYELLPAFVVSLIVIIVVSLCTKKPEEEIIEEFNQAK